MDWFRVHHELIDDPKFGGVRLELLGAWLSFLCVASRSKVRGTLPDVDEIAFRLRRPPAEVASFADEMVARRMLVRDKDGRLKVYKWEDYQKRSDSSAARVAKHRKAKAAEELAKAAQPDPVTLPKQGCNATPETAAESPQTPQPDHVTLQKRYGNALEEIREEKKTTNVVVSSPTPSQSPPPIAGADDDVQTGHPIRCPEHAALVAQAEAAFGPSFAAAVAEQGRDIEQTLGGRWECFAAAVVQAKASGRRINDVYRYCLAAANRYTVLGLPSPPVAAAPPAARSGPPPGGYHRAQGPPKRYRGEAAPPNPNPSPGPNGVEP